MAEHHGEYSNEYTEYAGDTQDKTAQATVIKREHITLSEREAARVRLQHAVDNLGREANLQLQMQKEPVKMLGVATGVGGVMGLLVGRSISRTKKIYVHPELSKKDQKAFAKAQKLQQRGNTDIGGALLATAGTLALKVLQDRVLAPKLTEIAGSLTDKAAQRATGKVPALSTSTGTAGAVSLSKPVLSPSSAPSKPVLERAAALLTERLAGEQEVPGVIIRDFRSAAAKARIDQYGHELTGTQALTAPRSQTELVSGAPSVIIKDGDKR